MPGKGKESQSWVDRLTWRLGCTRLRYCEIAMATIFLWRQFQYNESKEIARMRLPLEVHDWYTYLSLATERNKCIRECEMDVSDTTRAEPETSCNGSCNGDIGHSSCRSGKQEYFLFLQQAGRRRLRFGTHFGMENRSVDTSWNSGMCDAEYPQLDTIPRMSTLGVDLALPTWLYGAWGARIDMITKVRY